MLKTIIISLALASLSAISTAQSAGEVVRVGFADLDLNSRSGQVKLDQRISAACGDASAVDLEGRNAVRACRADAQAQVTAIRLANDQREAVIQFAARTK